MELNREQIIKALKCCSIGICGSCPYDKWEAGCRDEMCGDAIALIKELTEENERLRAENTELIMREGKRRNEIPLAKVIITTEGE